MKRKILFSLLILLLIIIGSCIFIGFPLIIVNNSSNPTILKIPDTLTQGDLVEPLKNLNFTQGTYAAYLIISRSDFKDLPPSIKKKRALSTKDYNLLKQLKEAFKFTYTGGDVSTCESKLFIFKNDSLVFKTSIVIEKEKVGLQNQYGWIEARDSKKIIEILQQFTSVSYPILFL